MNKFKILVNEFTYQVVVFIGKLVKSEVSNFEKKQVLDETITRWLIDELKIVQLNIVAKWFINKFVLPNISEITQFIYDLITIKIVGITKETEPPIFSQE